MVNSDLRYIAQNKARCIFKNNTIKLDKLENEAGKIIKNDQSLRIEFERYTKICLSMLTK